MQKGTWKMLQASGASLRIALCIVTRAGPGASPQAGPGGYKRGTSISGEAD